jgi:hypothetical protein
MSATDLLSEAALDSVDNSEAESDTEPDEERDEDELDNDLQLLPRALMSSGAIGQHHHLPRYGTSPEGRKVKKNVSAADLNKIIEEVLSPDERAVLDDYQRQLDELLQKRVTVLPPRPAGCEEVCESSRLRGVIAFRRSSTSRACLSQAQWTASSLRCFTRRTLLVRTQPLENGSWSAI